MTAIQLTCCNCGDDDSIEVEMTVDRGGRTVRFRADCSKCGTFSHYIDEPMLAHAAKEFLHEAGLYIVYDALGTREVPPKQFYKEYTEYADRMKRAIVGEAVRFGTTVVFKLSKPSIQES